MSVDAQDSDNFLVTSRVSWVPSGTAAGNVSGDPGYLKHKEVTEWWHYQYVETDSDNSNLHLGRGCTLYFIIQLLYNT